MSDVAKLSIKVNSDVSKAVRDLAALNLALHRVASTGGSLTHSLGGVNGTTNQQSSSMRQAARSTDANAQAIRNLGNDSKHSNLDMRSLLISMAIVAGTSLVPVAGASAGAILALGSAAASVGLGLGVFGLALSAIGKNKNGTLVAFNSMRAALKAWAQSVQGITMKPLDAFTTILPGALRMLTPMLITTANALTRGVHALGGWLKSKEASTNIKALTDAFKGLGGNLGGALGNFLRGILNVIVAFIPTSMRLTGGLKQLSAHFLKWSQTLDKNKGFQKFVTFVNKEGPKVWGDLGKITSGLIKFVTALNPLGTIVLTGLTSLVDALGKLDPVYINAIGAAIGALILAAKGAAIFTALSIALSGIGTVALVIVGVVAALAAGFYLLYMKSQPFHTWVVSKLIPGIKNLWAVIWNTLKPALDAIWSAIQTHIVPALISFGSSIQKAWKNMQPWVQLLGFLIKVILAGFKNILIYAVIPAIGLWIRAMGTANRWITMVIGAISKFILYCINNFIPIMKQIGRNFVTIWNSVYAFVSHIFGNIQHAAVVAWQTMYRNVTNWFNNVRNYLVSVWNAIYHNFSTIFGAIQHAAVTAWQNVVNGARTWFGRIKGIITGAFNGAVNWLKSAGGDLIHGFINGAQAIVSSIGSVIKGWGSTIINAVKAVFGIHSPSTVMHALGGHMMTGFINGIMHHGTDMGQLVKHALGITGDPFQWLASNIGGFGKSIITKIPALIGSLVKKVPNIVSKLAGMGGGILKSLGNFFGGGGGGGGVGNHNAILMQAAALAGVPMSWIGPMNTLVQRESGWNPNAINLTDSNAKAGHPSQGLAQTIPSTFATYGIPGLGGITNPLANLVAAFRYIKATYGSIFNVQQAVGATPKGYATGGYARGLVKVGEHGTELFDAGKGGHVYNAQETEQMLTGHKDCGSVTINVDKMYGTPEDAAKVAFKIRTQGMGLRTR